MVHTPYYIGIDQEGFFEIHFFVDYGLLHDPCVRRSNLVKICAAGLTGISLKKYNNPGYTVKVQPGLYLSGYFTSSQDSAQVLDWRSVQARVADNTRSSF